MKKIAVINFSGNVGKSTIAAHLLAPRMPGAAIVSVESINSGSASAIAIKGKQFGELQEDMLTVDCAVVDVGSSNVEDFLALMKQYRGSHEDFDLYLVPCVADVKQQKDTANCVARLASIGVPKEKIILVFNKVPEDADVAASFEALIAFAQAEQLCRYDLACTVFESELYGRIKDGTRSIAEIANDPRDIKQLIAKAASSAEKSALAAQLADKRLAQGVIENLDQVFSAIEALANE